MTNQDITDKVLEILVGRGLYDLTTCASDDGDKRFHRHLLMIHYWDRRHRPKQTCNWIKK